MTLVRVGASLAGFGPRSPARVAMVRWMVAIGGDQLRVSWHLLPARRVEVDNLHPVGSGLAKEHLVEAQCHLAQRGFLVVTFVRRPARPRPGCPRRSARDPGQRRRASWPR